MTALVPFGESREPSKARSWLERRPPLPSPVRVRQSAGWWATEGLGRVSALVVQSPVLLLRELKPITVGLFRVLSSWAEWCAAAHYAEAARAAEGSDRARHQERVEKRKTARRWCSLVFALSAGGTAWWAVEVHPQWAIATGLVAVGVLDLVGRAGKQQPDKPVPVASGPVLRDGVPLRQITETLIDVGLREGLELSVAAPMYYDPDRREYRVSVHCADEIKPDHVRAFERGLGASDYAMRNLATDTAGVRELVIRTGDPLATLVDRPWYPTGSRTVAEWQPLGMSMTEVPFSLPFAGVHIRAVMGTGGGKSKWFVRSVIDVLSSCRDVVLGGIDVTNGPELALWRGVIQYRGLDVEGAESVLDKALGEIDRRARILTVLAEDDDPDNDADEWHTGLGPAFVIIIDEFAQLAAFDGKGDKPDLLGKAEQIVRTGRKHWVSLVMASQQTGNSDFGSKVMQSMCGASVIGPCDPSDTVRMVGVEQRDAGYHPHLLSPGVEGDIRDAGKVYLVSPAHRTPDIYRAFAPGTTAEVKRRARQRVEDGLPTLSTPSQPSGDIDAVEVPPALALLEEAFAEFDVDRIPTAALLKFAGEINEDWTAEGLADALRPHGVETRKARSQLADGRSVMCYFRDDVARSLESL